MNMSIDGAFIYFTIPIFGGIPITQTAVSSFVVTALLVIACLCLGRNLKKRPGKMQVLTENSTRQMRATHGLCRTASPSRATR